MRINFLVVLISATVYFTSPAQNLPPILKTAKPKKGIYLTFDEFLNDAPSVQVAFVLQERSRSKQFWVGGSDYALLVPDGIGGMKKANKYWGLCDGDSIYINVSNYQKNRGYIKLLKLGRFCYTKGPTSDALEGNAAVAGVAAGVVGGVLANIPHEAAFIFNINNGKFIMLNADVLNKILDRDVELRDAFARGGKKDKNDPDIMLSYIERFNQRHADEIKRERLAKIVIYRRDKKERADTVTIMTGDSLRYTLAINEFEQFEAPKPTITLCWSDQCASFPVSIEKINYFQCLYRESDKQQVIPRDSKEGEYYIRQLTYLSEHSKE